MLEGRERLTCRGKDAAVEYACLTEGVKRILTENKRKRFSVLALYHLQLRKTS